MKITLLLVGKTDADYIEKGLMLYFKRIVHYLPFEVEIVPDLKQTKNLTFEQIKQQEGVELLKHFHAGDEIVLLDERGETFSSVEFASYIEKHCASGCKRLVFVIGGPYGFSPAVYAVAREKISLSRMTFSHQLVRLVFAEQLYRAMTILHHEPYHHE